MRYEQAAAGRNELASLYGQSDNRHKIEKEYKTVLNRFSVTAIEKFVAETRKPWTEQEVENEQLQTEIEIAREELKSLKS